MCGIAGEIHFDNTECNPAVTKQMCDAQIHRGPDDEGYYSDGPVSLGIRRLAIIDLTKGLYPLTNEQKTVHLVFNGEIYDFPVIRRELEDAGHKFRSNTDAEVIVHAYEQWDTNCFQKLNGMFAFALWDQCKRIMLIARDNFGIKPLYYHHDKNLLAFASEIKPLLLHPNIRVTPNEQVIEEYVRHGAVDQDPDETFFKEVSRLRAAHYLVITPEGSVSMNAYWRPQISRSINGEEKEREVEELRRRFLTAIRRQLVSDVPLGTCLSGGIDSSSIVSAIDQVRPRGEKIRTFTASFQGPIDETEYAREICDTANAEFNPVMPTASEFWTDLNDLVRCQEEPFLSTSIYAQWRVMKQAAQCGITVLLDGQGGDELFCGYVPYYIDYLATLKRERRYCQLLVESLLSIDLTYRFVIGHFRKMFHRNESYTSPSGLDQKTREDSYPPRGDLADALESLVNSTSLPALLRYEDKNSMWHSIEARVPFLDREFFEYAASLPLDRKLRNGWTKQIFREAMKGILPDKVRLRRRKIGFETPERLWITRDLREILREFFGSTLFAVRFYNVDMVKKLLDAHTLTDRQTSFIWRTLNLELWYREFFKERYQ